MSRGINKVILVGNVGQDPEVQKAFWSKVKIQENTNACWEWDGAKKPKGYGNVRINGSYLLAHRVAFELAVSPIPDGFIVCHICDNPSCCNPNHLMLGTAKSNAADMLLKNRQKNKIYAARGENNGNSKLTKLDVITIRKSHAANDSVGGIANKFNISKTTVRNIVSGKTWGHI